MLIRLFKSFLPDLKDTVRRFPLAVGCAVVFTLMALGDIKADVPAAATICGCFFFIALKLLAESKGWTDKTYYTIGLPVFGLIILRLATATEIGIPTAFLAGGFFFSMFIAPYLRRDVDSSQIWQFNYAFWCRIAFTFIAALVIFLGYVSILASFTFLFGINGGGSLYFKGWIICACLFSPLFAMAGIPKQFDVAPEAFPKSLRIITAYIALPMILIYALVLYAYAAKIGTMWDLPKGTVAYLVSGFGGVGIAVWLSLYPLYDGGKSMVAWFGRHFFKLLLLPLLLLAIAIGTRVHAYGVTEERYAVLLCLTWLIAVSLYGMIRPAKGSAVHFWMHRRPAPRRLLWPVGCHRNFRLEPDQPSNGAS